MADGRLCDVEGLSEEVVLMALLQMWAASLRGGHFHSLHLSPAVWRGMLNL